MAAAAKCLLNGDTPTTYPIKGETCRIFRFEKTDVEITGEMLSSKEKDTLFKCISAGVLPEVLQRDDAWLEVVKRREQGKCTLGKRRIISLQEGETRRNEAFYDRAREDRIIRKTNHRFKAISLSEEESSWDEWVIPQFYPHQQHLRKRNTVVEHPYGTVKRWHGAGCWRKESGKQRLKPGFPSLPVISEES